MPAALGLSTYRWNNNLKSVFLLLLFPFLLMGLLAGICYASGFIYMDPNSGLVSPLLFQSLDIRPVLGTGRPEDFALSVVYAYWPIVTGIAATWLVIGYFFNDSIIHAATGARAVTRQEAPKLYNTLENLCISRGLKTPHLYVIDGDEMNAYASGIDQSSYAITVTRGLVETLNDDEMEAVLAHELTHIINRDCRLMIVTIVFVGMISFAAQMIWRGLRYASYGRSRDREGGGGVLLIMLIAGVMLGIGYSLALVLRFAISRKREYLADAGSVELTKNPEALIGALRKISSNCDVPHVPTEVRQMFIENPPSLFDLGGLFATHPPIADRIHILEELGGLPPEGKSVIPNSSEPG
ncbi:MAG: M48 family metallopeptidase [Pseudomonadota bacterium]|nr:M48 family metallopeptidase [Pseudomonadota bacterium]